MKKLWTECVLPEADIHYADTLREMQRNGPKEILDNPPEDPRLITTAVCDDLRRLLATAERCVFNIKRRVVSERN